MQNAHAGHTHGPETPTGLRIAFVVTASILVLEAVGGWLTGSVALLADAGHMLTDAGALGVALFAAWVATRPRSERKSFGYGRAEILAALGNGLLLGAVSVAIATESVSRLGSEPEVDAGPMVAIAVVGLAANGISALALSRSNRHNLNVRAAMFHVIGDALGSVAAIIAGVSILLFDLVILDAIAGLGIAALLVVSAVRLVREATDILLEGTPAGLHLETVAGRVCELAGVRAIHDLHVWTVTSGFPAMSAHVDLEKGADPEEVRRAVHRLLHQEYDIEHTTIQTEAHREPELLEIEQPAIKP
jgi:cobalt-zinc-cadmium efflux system protein